ncbi:uncharacterized protein BO96DRAFT_145947 [Aspergillus niger CBS 101883]|uniref:uncharacterized protein n=1 Tax=Aspergillus lacticoffeatus (strain CBS 101883) TaxID=1450533 RepID=UPI000D7FBBC9|nr:uncharacterized protein BO96DRAFT_145947 [Aspergillus niger CBS 101883]PYH60670.1 hypothetical protein BO96DRAFT_145947 [Aspergillus niger CBS 101883]
MVSTSASVGSCVVRMELTLYIGCLFYCSSFILHSVFFSSWRCSINAGTSRFLLIY